MTKVCILVHNSVATDARVRNQADALATAGYQVTVLGVQNPTDSGHPEWLRNRRWRLHLLNRDKRTWPSRWCWLRSAARSHAAAWLGQRLTLHAGLGENALIRAYPELCALATAERADIYHANDLNTLPIACQAAARCGGRVIYDAHELYTEELPNLPAAHRRLVAFVESRYIRRADRVITVSDGIAQILAQLYAIRLPTTIYNVAPLALRPAAALAPLDVAEPSQLSLLHHGHLGFGARGLEDLLAALPLLAEGIELHLRGQLSDEARRAIAGLPEAARRPIVIHPLCSPEQLLTLAARHQVGLVLTQPLCRSLEYSAPNKLFQYLMAGLAVVCTDLPEARRLLTGSEVGLTYRPGDPQGLAAAINRLASDRALLRRLRQNGRQLAAQRFNWEHEQQKLLAIYRELA